jgi:hypothetical protein
MKAVWVNLIPVNLTSYSRRVSKVSGSKSRSTVNKHFDCD